MWTRHTFCAASIATPVVDLGKNIPENCAFCLVRSMRHVLTVLIKGPSPPCTMLGLPPMATATFETSVHPKACLALRICTVAIGN